MSVQAIHKFLKALLHEATFLTFNQGCAQSPNLRFLFFQESQPGSNNLARAPVTAFFDLLSNKGFKVISNCYAGISRHGSHPVRYIVPRSP